jgi:hypothetical protein
LPGARCDWLDPGLCAARQGRAFSPSGGGLNDMPRPMNLQSQAKKFANQICKPERRSLFVAVDPACSKFSKGCTLARVLFLEKEKIEESLENTMQAFEKYED